MRGESIKVMVNSQVKMASTFRFLGKLILAFLICFVGFVAIILGYNILNKTSVITSTFSDLAFFYIFILVVMSISYKVLASNRVS